MDKNINISSTNSIGNGLNPIYSWILHWIFSFQGSHRISDNAVVALLSFFATVLKRVVPQLGSLPNTLYTARKAIGLLQPTGCTKFVVCPTCHKLYNEDAVLGTKVGQPTVPKCTHVVFPRHPLMYRRRACGSELASTYQKKDETILRPLSTYSYRSLKVQLQEMFSRPGFFQLLSRWASRNVPDGVLGDIYDGSVWKNFLVGNVRF
jgi:hypothetical protein